MLFVGRIVSNDCLSPIRLLCFPRKPFPRELIDKPNVLAVELRDDESLSTTESTSRHVWYEIHIIYGTAVARQFIRTSEDIIYRSTARVITMNHREIKINPSESVKFAGKRLSPASSQCRLNSCERGLVYACGECGRVLRLAAICGDLPLEYLRLTRDLTEVPGVICELDDKACLSQVLRRTQWLVDVRSTH